MSWYFDFNFKYFSNLDIKTLQTNQWRAYYKKNFKIQYENHGHNIKITKRTPK